MTDELEDDTLTFTLVGASAGRVVSLLERDQMPASEQSRDGESFNYETDVSAAHVIPPVAAKGFAFQFACPRPANDRAAKRQKVIVGAEGVRDRHQIPPQAAYQRAAEHFQKPRVQSTTCPARPFASSTKMN